MKVPDEIRKTVGFVAFEDQSIANRGAITPVGSCFFVGEDPADGSGVSPRVFAVTAAHVLRGLERNGLREVILRLNTVSGAIHTVRTQLENWNTHPDDPTLDIAICEMGIPAWLDHLVIPRSMFVNDGVFQEHEVALGDEVFVSGLFRHHFGEQRNIPIVRVGNLAALEEEGIVTRDFGRMAAYLIEARSIGGLSGSPVFLNLGHVRSLKGELKFSGAGIFFFARADTWSLRDGWARTGYHRF